MTEAPANAEQQGTPEGTPEAPPERGEPFFVARTQEDLNKKVGDLRQQARGGLLKELGFEDFDDLKETVEAYRVVEQEMQTDAERFEAELEKVRPRAEKAERYEEALKGYLDKEREGLPAHITALLDRMDPVDQLAWIGENREAIAEAAVPPSIGAGSNPGDLAAGSGGDREQALSMFDRKLRALGLGA